MSPENEDYNVRMPPDIVLTARDQSRLPCLSVVTSYSWVRTGTVGMEITWAIIAYARLSIAVCAHGCGIHATEHCCLGPRLQPLVLLILALLSIAPYVKVVHAASKIFW